MAAVPRMALLFSYGTLQEPAVQRETFGRRLDGRPDTLPGYTTARVPIVDPVQRAAMKRTYYDNVVPAAEAAQVEGTAFEVTEDELADADDYERDADYVRVRVTLGSGDAAWVYLHQPSS